MSISFLFSLFSFLSYSMTMPDALTEEKKKKNWNNDNNDDNDNEKKRSSKSRILNVYILINIALFICSNEKTLIIMTEIWNLIWRCMKSVKILVIALTLIVFAILKSSFAFAKRIYMMLTSSNKHLQAIKRAE